MDEQQQFNINSNIIPQFNSIKLFTKDKPLHLQIDSPLSAGEVIKGPNGEQMILLKMEGTEELCAYPFGNCQILER